MESFPLGEKVFFVSVRLSGLRVKTAREPSLCLMHRTYGPSTASRSFALQGNEAKSPAAITQIFQVASGFMERKVESSGGRRKPPIYR
jgi:hypothetical protein